MPISRPLPALLAAAVLLAVAATATQAQTAPPVRHHALSLIDKPKFGPDFKSFSWVNPNAPIGGNVRMWSEGSFDNLNSFTINGEAADQLDLIYDQLMTSSADEPTAEYGLIAEWISFPPD